MLVQNNFRSSPRELNNLDYMDRVKRIWYLSPMLIQAVSQEEPSDRKPDAQLKFVMTECSKTQIRLTEPICLWSTAEPMTRVARVKPVTGPQ